MTPCALWPGWPRPCEPSRLSRPDGRRPGRRRHRSALLHRPGCAWPLPHRARANHGLSRCSADVRSASVSRPRPRASWWVTSCRWRPAGWRRPAWCRASCSVPPPGGCAGRRAGPARATSEDAVLAAVTGAVAAGPSAWVGSRWRALPAVRRRALVGALLEDAVAVALGVRAAGGPVADPLDELQRPVRFGPAASPPLGPSPSRRSGRRHRRRPGQAVGRPGGGRGRPGPPVLVPPTVRQRRPRAAGCGARPAPGRARPGRRCRGRGDGRARCDRRPMDLPARRGLRRGLPGRVPQRPKRRPGRPSTAARCTCSRPR